MNNQNIKSLIENFYKIKNQGYIKATRSGTTGIGKTFEDLIGKSEDKNYMPDYKGIEIKTKNYYSNAYTTLFNLTPRGKTDYEIKRLKEKYGYPDKILKRCRVLNNSVFASKDSLIGNRYYFKLIINRDKSKIFLLIKNKDHNVIEETIYWDFEELKKRLEAKLSYLAFIKAWKTTRNNELYYKYVDLKIYKLKDFNTFINLIESGKIIVTFHIGVFRDGSRYSQIHDRGTSFQIQDNDLLLLFDRIC